MSTGMTVAKIAVSLPQEVLDRARLAVKRGRAPNLSAYVGAALEQKAKLDELEELLDEMLRETGGPPTAAEQQFANEVLGVRPRRKRASR